VSQGKQRIVVTRQVPDPLVPLLQQGGFDVVVHDSVEPMKPDELVEFVRGAHAIVPISDDKMTDEVFAAAGPGLKIVANYAVGYDNVDLAVCRREHVLPRDSALGDRFEAKKRATDALFALPQCEKQGRLASLRQTASGGRGARCLGHAHRRRREQRRL